MKNKIFVLFVPVFISLLFSVSGEEPKISSLMRGPVRSVGFPLIYPNAIETWQGYYRYLNDEVIVSFTAEKVVIPDEWEPVSCEKLDGFSPEPFSFYFKDENWSLLFQFTPVKGVAGLSDSYCTFTDKFVTRLRYLLRDSDAAAPPLLPAILEF